MRGKTLIAIGLCWLAAILLWLHLGFSFFVQEPGGRVPALAVRLLFQAGQAVYELALLGWIVPLGLGLYRRLRR